MLKRLVLPAIAAAGACLCSPAHATVLSGEIEVFNGSTLIGYVSDAYDSQNSFTYTSNSAKALDVQINNATSTFAIEATNPPDSSNPYLGAVGGSGGYVFGSGQVGYAYLAGTSLIAAGSTPSSSGTTSLQVLGYNGPAESTIWSLTGNVLSALWTNANSTTDNATIFYDPVVDYLGIGGDLNTYNNTYGDNAYAVTLEFTGAPSGGGSVPEPASFAVLGGALLALGLVRRRPSV